MAKEITFSRESALQFAKTCTELALQNGYITKRSDEETAVLIAKFTKRLAYELSRPSDESEED